MLNVPEKIEKFVSELAMDRGYLLVGMSVKGRRTLAVEILLDKEGGITLDECGEFNRIVNSWLEAEDVLGRDYLVDVCSPGLDRALKETPDFLWAKGRKVKVSLFTPLNRKNAFTGELIEVKGDSGITLMTEDGPVDIERDIIAGARLYLEKNIKKKKTKRPTKKGKKKKK
ncbi:MAG: hypothetical protein GF408_07330 [Candidatus Omnitrophica bacterium]|nr:hypothetical protein [Candidatus Omnitrophota bacterium]